jgi:hypothetical protein
MNVNQLKQSKFLTRSDVGKGVLATIRGDVYQENVAKEGAPEDLKWVIEFEELEKPMVLNSTNGQLIAHITKSEESENWRGHKVVLYDDPSVSFGGKLVGGIRIRAPKGPKLIVPGSPAFDANPAKPIPQPAPDPRYAEAQKAFARPQQPTSGINNPVLRRPPEPEHLPAEPPEDLSDDVPF